MNNIKSIFLVYLIFGLIVYCIGGLGTIHLTLLVLANTLLGF